MIKIDKNKSNKQWFEYSEGVEFLIKPFPLSERALSPSNSNITEILIKQAMYCLQDWKGVVDSEDKPIKCSDENKKFIFDFSHDIVIWVCEKSHEMNNGIVNLPSKKI